MRVMLNRPATRTTPALAASLAISMGILLWLLPWVVMAQEPPRQVRVTVDQVDVRSDAGPVHPIVVSVARGTVLSVLDQTGDWYRVRLGPEVGTEAAYGFVHRGNVERLERVAVDTSPPPAPDLGPETEGEARDSEGADSRPGSLSVGVTAAIPYEFGPMPSVFLDIGERLTLKGSLALPSGSAIGIFGELLYRWPSSFNPGASVRFEPFVGGGVLAAAGRNSPTEFSVTIPFLTGGAFMHLRDHPRWRLQGSVNTVFSVLWTSVGVGYSL